MIQIFKKLPAHERRLTLSTKLTLARMLLVPFIVWTMVIDYWATALVLFSVAALTDMLDGNLARSRNEQTILGACLDPLADKVLLLSCFVTLALIPSPFFGIPLWFVGLLLLKDLILVFGVMTIYWRSGVVSVHPTKFGKATTVLLLAFIAWLFACYFFGWEPIKTYYVVLSLSFIAVIGSLLQYVRIGFVSWRWLNGSLGDD